MVLICHKRNKLPNDGGVNDQDWDFVYWSMKLEEFIAEHERTVERARQFNT